MVKKKKEKITRTQASRSKNRMNYDPNIIFPILDEALVCTVSYVKGGEPRALPTGHVRVENHLYIHGSAKSHFFQQLEKAEVVCITAFILDGIVLAKSGLNHSFNYRSAVLYGAPQIITDYKRKEKLLGIFTNHYIPGRWEKIRKPNRQELNATTILGFNLEEISAKSRQGMPNDLEKDKNWPAWSGIVPMRMQILEPIPDENNVPGTSIPNYIKQLQT